MLVWKMSSDKGDPQPSLKACTLLIPESAVSNCHNFETKKNAMSISYFPRSMDLRYLRDA